MAVKQYTRIALSDKKYRERKLALIYDNCGKKLLGKVPFILSEKGEKLYQVQALTKLTHVAACTSVSTYIEPSEISGDVLISYRRNYYVAWGLLKRPLSSARSSTSLRMCSILADRHILELSNEIYGTTAANDIVIVEDFSFPFDVSTPWDFIPIEKRKSILEAIINDSSIDIRDAATVLKMSQAVLYAAISRYKETGVIHRPLYYNTTGKKFLSQEELNKLVATHLPNKWKNALVGDRYAFVEKLTQYSYDNALVAAAIDVSNVNLCITIKRYDATRKPLTKPYTTTMQLKELCSSTIPNGWRSSSAEERKRFLTEIIKYSIVLKELSNVLGITPVAVNAVLCDFRKGIVSNGKGVDPVVKTLQTNNEVVKDTTQSKPAEVSAIPHFSDLLSSEVSKAIERLIDLHSGKKISEFAEVAVRGKIEFRFTIEE